LNILSGIFGREDLRFFVSRSWAVCWPMTLIMLFEFLIGLTDVYIAGRLGKEIQAAYGFAIQLYFIFIVAANAVTVGTVAVVSRLSGLADRTALREAVNSSLAVAAICGALLALAGSLFPLQIIRLLHMPDSLRPFSVSLLRIYALGLFFHYLLINSNGVLRAANRVKTSLLTMALVCLLNIALNFFLVFHTPLGFRGIALSTAASVCAGSLVNFRVIFREYGRARFSRLRAKAIIQIGWPMGLLQVLWQLGSMVLFLILSTLPEHRVEILAALTAGLRIESVIYLPAFAFNMANAVLIGNFLGEKKSGEAFRAGLITAAMGVSTVTLLVLLVIANAGRIASLLSDNPIVIQESIRYIYISMISEPFMAWGAILSGGLNGAGDTRNVLLRVAFSIWGIRIPLVYIFVVVLGYGAASVWWSMNISQFAQALLMSERYLRRRWLDRARPV
jgi:multidrug resistance protein, MATE family